MWGHLSPALGLQNAAQSYDTVHSTLQNTRYSQPCFIAIRFYSPAYSFVVHVSQKNGRSVMYSIHDYFRMFLAVSILLFTFLIAQTQESNNRKELSSLVSDFDGLTVSYLSHSPNLSIAKGPNYIVEALDYNIGIFQDDGSFVSVETLNNFFSGVYSGNPDQCKVIYHPQLNRYFLLALGDQYYLIAFTETNDPTGNWIKFKSDASLNDGNSSNLHPEEPDIGFNDNYLLITSNQYTSSNAFVYGKIRAFRFSDLLQGNYSDYTDFWDLQNADGTIVHSFRAAQHRSSSTDAYLVNTNNLGGDFITLWKLYEDGNQNLQIQRAASFTVEAY